jgi:TrmH family RNA methyltransferase
MITSSANPLVKAAAALHRRSERERTDRFLIEGAAEINRALEARVVLERIFVEEGADLPEETVTAWERAAAVSRLSSAAFAKIAYGRDGVVAIAHRPAFDLATFVVEDPALILVAEGVEKPGNLGAMIRTADAAGAAILVADPVTDLTNPNVVRASLGSLFSTQIAQAPTIGCLAWLGSRNITLVAATVDEGGSPWVLDLTAPVALAVGSEHRGLSSAVLGKSAHRTQIPMRGAVDSLNASIAAAILLYEAVRQRHPVVDIVHTFDVDSGSGGGLSPTLFR